MSELLPTGISVLDRKLDGGIPPGSLIALSAAPASQSEQFLYELTAWRRTLFVTTRRTADGVRAALERGGGSVENTRIIEVEADYPLARTRDVIESFPRGVNVIVDPVNVLETESRARYTSFLNAVRARAVAQEGLVFLHCLDGRYVPDQRDVTEYLADIVFELTTGVRGDKIENRLLVPKFRGQRAVEEAIRLEMAEGITIDTSRDIA